jgi:glycogen operon protein
MVNEHRLGDVRALLGTLFASTGTIMLTAGDEFGHSQRGNNNAYCQDNDITWLDWENRDTALEDYVVDLAAIRAAALETFIRFPEPGDWLHPDGRHLAIGDWESHDTPGLSYRAEDGSLEIDIDRPGRLAVYRA